VENADITNGIQNIEIHFVSTSETDNVFSRIDSNDNSSNECNAGNEIKASSAARDMLVKLL
jgi:hypothetical protein